MEEYPEELRTPPVSLVSLVGCPELHTAISAALHAEQPPMNTLALPDFSKVSLISRHLRHPLDPGHPPAGILKKDWIAKHRTRVPAVVAALFMADRVKGDPAQWLQVCTDLDYLKSVIRSRNIKLVVVLVQATEKDDIDEDLMTAVRKHAEIDSRYIILFFQNNPSELEQSYRRLISIFAELCHVYYRDEGRRIKTHLEKKSFSSPEMNVRYCFKVAIYAEFRRDWAEALKFYEDAYSALREMVVTSTRLSPFQRLVEIKAVAEQLHFKLSTLLLHGGKVVEAVAWFNKHIASYERLVGAKEVAFLHWEWFSRQYLVFAELLETSSSAVPISASQRLTNSINTYSEWEFLPAYYYQLSANYLREKKLCLAQSVSMISDLGILSDDCPDSVIQSVFVGQLARSVEEGDNVTSVPLSDAEYTNYAVTEAKRYQDSYEIIALYKRSLDSFNSLKAARVACYASNRMAIEYFEAGDFCKAKELFDGVAGLYRQDGWTILLWEILGYLRDCCRKLGSFKDFVGYSLEMTALPIVSDYLEEYVGRKKEQGTAGLPTLSQRVAIHDEVFAFFMGNKPISSLGESFTLEITDKQPFLLEVDLVTPLRMVFLASVAFHDQFVKPGSFTEITLSILSHLPRPVVLDHLEVHFNQPLCNFRVINGAGELSAASSVQAEPKDVRVETVTSLILSTNKWLRLTCKVQPGESGKLECLSVTAKVGNLFKIRCLAESPASMESLPLWRFEDAVETPPTKDRGLSFSGQKFIQVEEPEPQVDLISSSSGPALLGEKFVVPVTVHCKGHAVHSGELKINLVDARGGGLLMSPRAGFEPFSSDVHHVELLNISGLLEEDESQMNLGDIKQIQRSFGVVSVPDLEVGETWSCELGIRWHKPRSVMLYVSLGYSRNNTTDVDPSSTPRINVHKSLQIDGIAPILVSDRFMTSFRQEPLLLSKVKSASVDSEKKIQLPLNELSIIVIGARNCTEVPLRLLSMTIEPDENGKGRLCTFHPSVSSTNSYNHVLAPGEEFKRVFSLTPHVESRSIRLGTVILEWSRASLLDKIVMKHELPDVSVEKPVLVARFECPPHAVVGEPLLLYVKVKNMTNLLQEIRYSLSDSQSFVFCGPHNDTTSILPQMEHVLSYKLVPLSSGSQRLPTITVTSLRYSAALHPSAAAMTLFVYPSESKFQIEGRESSAASVAASSNRK